MQSQSDKSEVKILNKDVGFVRTGQVASVQLDAFNYIKYGAIDGVVVLKKTKVENNYNTNNMVK